MDTSTQYLGFALPHPFVLGASPLVDDLDSVRRAEDAGAAAIVMHSLFQEQIEADQAFDENVLHSQDNSYPEAMSYTPVGDAFALTPDEYLEQIRRIKAAVSVPVIASLNGTSNRGWLEYATLCAEAGADALELNVYQIPTDTSEPAEAIEQRTLDMVKAVKGHTTIPVAVKLSPFYTSLAHLAARLEQAGADGLVLFNRFYQPDIDVEQLDVLSKLELSTSSELLLRLRWLAILSPGFKGSLAVTGGVHTGLDAVKALMAGAHAVQVVSTILQRGPQRFTELANELREWLAAHGYVSLSQLRGSMNLARCPNPSNYERGNYMRLLQSWGRRPAA